MTEPMLIAIFILCLVVGPFIQRLWDRFDKPRHRPERPEQLRDAARALATWLNEGQGSGLLRAEVQNDYPNLLVDDANVSELDNWLRRAPFTAVVKGETLAKGERARLEWWFWAIFAWLIILGTVAALGIIFESRLHPDNKLVICILSGLFGGCIAAFRSCLDRRANGFEDRHGNRAPEPEVRKERFGDGIARWFLGRPALSASVGLLVYFALIGNVFPEAFTEEISKTVGRLVFYTSLAGLLAKTLLDLFLEAGKKIFRVE